MITAGVIEQVQARLSDGFYISFSQYGSLVISTPDGERNLRIPEGWGIEAHKKGYGGWLISRGRVTRFCRVLATPKLKKELLEVISSEKLDSRSPGTAQFVADFIGDQISLLSFEEQLVEEILRIIKTLSLKSKSREAQAKQELAFSKGVSDFLTHFPSMLNPGQQLPFYRHTLAFDQEFPSGIREAVRDHFVEILTDMQIPSPVSEGLFKVDPTATSKNSAGTWVTTIKTNTIRKGFDGSILSASPNAPVMLLATQPIIGSRKRGPREMGGIKHALPLVVSRPPDEFIWNGYEDYLTQQIKECMTNVFVLFADIEDLNSYDSNGKQLNLDDILITPEGHTALTTTIRNRSVFTPEQWESCKERYMNGEYPKDGVFISNNPLLETSFEGIPLYRQEIVVIDADKPEDWRVGKVLLDSMHKAMMKEISHSLIAVDDEGKEYTVEVIVSAISVTEKKIESMLLSATLARLNYGYIADPEEYDYMPEEVKQLLRERGQNEEGLLKVYRVDDEGFRHYVGSSLGGYLRAVRLQENEEAGSKVRIGGAIPIQTPLRHLVRKPAILDKRTEHLVNTLSKTYSAITKVGAVEEELVEIGS